MVAEKKENNSTEEEGSITENQLKLILELYVENPAFEKVYPQKDLTHLSQKAGNRHIQLLLEYKKTHNGKKTLVGETQFKDVSFGMIYKLVWKERQNATEAWRYLDAEFVRKVYEEYVLYLKTRNSVEAQFKKEAVK